MQLVYPVSLPAASIFANDIDQETEVDAAIPPKMAAHN
jgi:hypothetical protein